ncbi:DUF4097 domain-containing protein [Ruminococcaceae bacterium OttesenSCG-928-A16]|nr:DUF4097 domain-containing protein [Ruminococcaceae bacterium OttesenSCG-928-A16]
MKHKGLLIFCSVLLLAGVCVSAVGFAMGGRPGSFNISQGKIVYYNGAQRYELGDAPGGWGARWGNGGNGVISAPVAPVAPSAPAAPTVPSAPAAPTVPSAPAGQGGQAAATVNVAQLKKLEVDISAGYVVIVAGTEASLAVDGNMPYTSTFEEGKWEIKSTDENLYQQWMSGRNRFFLNGEDVTTTFTITLPAQLNELEGELNMGEMTLTGLAIQELDLEVNMGAIVVKNCSAVSSEFSTNMGSTKVQGFSGRAASISNDMGSTVLEGDITESLEIDCDMGSVTATLKRPASYNWHAEVGLGSIKLDGNSITGQGKNSGNNGGTGNPNSPYYDLECGLGSIKLSFSN